MEFNTAARIASDLRDKGETSTPNVEAVRMAGVRLVHGKIPQAVRAELKAGVTAGRLGHLKKQHLRPEAFFHPNSRWRALELRDKEFNQAVSAIRGTLATQQQVDEFRGEA